LFTRLSELPADKTAPIVVMCKSGHRGSIALVTLPMNGYTNGRNLAGGLNAGSPRYCQPKNNLLQTRIFSETTKRPSQCLNWDVLLFLNEKPK
jgi:hypothetical protein